MNFRNDELSDFENDFVDKFEKDESLYVLPGNLI